MVVGDYFHRRRSAAARARLVDLAAGGGDRPVSDPRR
jgi:hypothetical protein